MTLSAHVRCDEFHNKGMCKYTKSRKGTWRVVVVLAMPNDTPRQVLMRIEDLVEKGIRGHTTAFHIARFEQVASLYPEAKVFL